MEAQEVRYAGFWVRTAATVIDSVIIMLITIPPLISIYGWAYLDKKGIVAGPADFLISWVLPAAAIILFWKAKQATPGKMALSLKIVDAKSGGPLSTGQAIGRYFAYIISSIPLGLGFIWVAFDKRKQSWQDKIAGTLVIRNK